MSIESYPTRSDRQIISCTGHSNVIQATGGKVKTVILQARVAVAGASLTDNSQGILVGVGSDPGTGSAFNGFILGPGEMMTLAVDDTSALYFRGASGDTLFITALN